MLWYIISRFRPNNAQTKTSIITSKQYLHHHHFRPTFSFRLSSHPNNANSDSTMTASTKPKTPAEAIPLSIIPASPPTAIAPNNLLTRAAKGEICTAFGIKIITGSEIVQIAKSGGYDSLFIDLEHTTLTLRDVGQLCIAAVSAGITPFVRVPHQCGLGFMQRVLDAGAMGLIVPHIHTVGKPFSTFFSRLPVRPGLQCWQHHR